jgi:hypothetical protein
MSIFQRIFETTPIFSCFSVCRTRAERLYVSHPSLTFFLSLARVSRAIQSLPPLLHLAPTIGTVGREPLSFHFSFIIYCLLLALYSSNQAITSLYFPVMSVEFPGLHKETGCCLPSLATLRENKGFSDWTYLAIFEIIVTAAETRVRELKMSKCV